MRSTWSACGSVLVATVLLALTACGDGATSRVSGKVTYDGKPIEKGVISFIPMDRKTTDAGGEIVNGQYSVLVPPGEMKVVISMGEISGYKELYKNSKAPGPAPKQALTREVLPIRYSSREKSELRLDVTSGGMEKDWILKKS